MGDHPWRRLRNLTDWLLGWADLPDEIVGLTHHESKVIILDRRMLQVERRCTLAHELEHVARGPMPADPVLAAREEDAIDQAVARKLIPAHRLLDVAHWTRDHAEAADELWVDVPTLLSRLRGLDPDERAHIDARLETIHLP